MSTSDLSLKIEGIIRKKARNEREFKRTLSNISSDLVSDIRRRTYHGRMRSQYELRQECIHEKKSEWKESGPINKEFNVIPAFKPDIIDGWKAIRILMPERSYQKIPVSKVMKFPPVKGEIGEFIPLGNDDMPKENINDKKMKLIPGMKDLRKPFNIKKADYDRKLDLHSVFLIDYKNRIGNK